MLMDLRRKLFSQLIKYKQKQPLSIQKQHDFLKRLYRLIENGYSLLEALEILHWEKSWQYQTNLIIETLKNGKSLHIALQEANFHKKVISFMYFAMLDGDLETALKQCCLMLNQQIQFTKKFKQTARYPLFLGILFITLLYFIKNSVYPSFLHLFSSTSGTSKITDFAITFIHILFQILVYGSLCLIIIYGSWLLMKEKLSVENRIKVYHLIPFFHFILKLNNSFLFSIHLSSLLNAGLSLKACLETLHNQQQLPIISYYSNRMISELKRGKSITSVLPSCSMFTKELYRIFNKNINNQVLAKDLAIYAEFLIEQIESKTKQLIDFIQPAFFIMIGGLILFIYLTLMLPMFQLIQNL
ncbi:competence type IV pilus assembly protein ComGB [Aquibacillus albus]|uniref:Competence protein ComGB n=1 Tax=Aquibacillus albus TaxID=1168171 RepID=A0ABS2MV20_9BACI|nr:competence type IV pilus assembly protein ComGB [Aquibacillus albus]MBM7569680.1 competence protein ComGB [Aquibacillus albus]